MEGKHGTSHELRDRQPFRCFGDRIEVSPQSKSDTEKKERPTLIALNA
jgi:hypothetical protein